MLLVIKKPLNQTSTGTCEFQLSLPARLECDYEQDSSFSNAEAIKGQISLRPSSEAILPKDMPDGLSQVTRNKANALCKPHREYSVVGLMFALY